MTKELLLVKTIIIGSIASMFRHHNNKFIEFLYVNGQRNLLPMPFQPKLSFNIVPFGTISGNARNFTIDPIQYEEYPSIENFSKY